jgi:transcriptional regulator of acetoin/glycerol metabolism
MYAASIENRLLMAQSTRHFVVKFQFMPGIVNTPMAGMLGFDESGTLVWVNAVASTLLNLAPDPALRGHMSVEAIFAIKASRLADLVDAGLSQVPLTHGPQVYLTCEAQFVRTPLVPRTLAKMSAATNVVLDQKVPLLVDGYLPPSSLKDADADLIRKCLAECHGNVSKVARKLKVSRGLIYRRLQELSIDPAEFKTK